MNALKNKTETYYFDELPESIQELVKDLIIEAADDRHGPEGFKSSDECIDSLECRARDGFRPFSHNRGGIVYQNFCMVRDYESGGYTPKHKKAAAEIERQNNYNIECLVESIQEKHAETFLKFNVTKEQINYHDLEDLSSKHPELKDAFRDYEHGEYDSDGQDSIMHEFRFMYHGQDERGNHSASVSAAINTEGPYHRSSISWLPNAFCEGAKEIEITWKTENGLKTKLKKALKACSEEIF